MSNLAPRQRVGISCENINHANCLGDRCGHACCSEANPEYELYMNKARTLERAKQLRKHVQDAALNYEDLPLDATTDIVIEFLMHVESEKEDGDYRGAAAVLAKKAKLDSIKEAARELSTQADPLSIDDWRTFAVAQCAAVSAQNEEFKSEIKELLTNFAPMKASESVTAVANRLERLGKIKAYTYLMLTLPPQADQDLTNGETLIKALTPELGRIAYAEWMKLNTLQRTFKKAKDVALQAEMVANRFGTKRNVQAVASPSAESNMKTLGSHLLNGIQSISQQLNALSVKSKDVVPAMNCGICDSKQHYAKDCTKPPTCYFCFEQGHMRDACPKEKASLRKKVRTPSSSSDDDSYEQYMRDKRQAKKDKDELRQKKSKQHNYDDDGEDYQYEKRRDYQRGKRKKEFNKERGEKRKQRQGRDDSDEGKQPYSKNGEPRVCPREKCNGDRHFLKDCPNYDGCEDCGAKWHIRCKGPKRLRLK